MSTTPGPSFSRTVATQQAPSTPTPTAPSTPLPAQDIKRIQLSAPTDIPAPPRTSSSFPPTPIYVPASASSSNPQPNGTPSTQHRGVKLDQVAERQANASANGPAAPGLSAKALGKRKRTVEEEEIIQNAGQVFKDNTERDAAYFTVDYLPVHPFESGRDIVDRLLPFHLWQIHDQDLDCRPKDAKRRSNERVGVDKLVTRHISLIERLRKAQVRQDDSDSRVDVIQISQAVVQTMRDATSQLQAQLRDAKAENDRITSENRRRDEARRAASIAAGEKPLPRPGPGRPPGVASGTPNMSRTTSVNGASMPGTPGSAKGAGIPGGSAAGPSQASPEVAPSPISVNIPINLRPDLVRLQIVAGSAKDTKAPARIVTKSEDGQSLVLSVYPKALNPSQLNFLAGVLTRQQQQGRKPAGSPAAASSPATSASSPKTVDTS